MVSRRGFLVGSAASTTGILLLGCQGAPKAARVRDVARVIRAVPRRDGAGVALRRSLGAAALAYLDPFLLLDEIHSANPADYTAGFPSHPHRGFETVSYVLRGGFQHRDNVGNRGLIADGGAQWMTAGRGILHEEMPVQTRGTELWGLQLWVNLPASHKLIKPRYQDLGAAVIPELAIADARVRLVAGTVGATRGPIDGIATRPTLLDATLEPRATFRHDLPGTDTAFLYVLAGRIAVGPRAVAVGEGELAVLEPGTTIGAASESGGRFLLVAGAPINEPIARRGPFVMTTQAEVEQAFADFRSGRLTAE